MPRIRIAILICAVSLVGRGFAQTVTSDTRAALAKEWKSDKGETKGKDQCLKALELYSRDHPSNEDLKQALDELTKAASTIDGAPKADQLYELAKDLGTLSELLATATGISIDKNDSGAVDRLFAEADIGIATAYRSAPKALRDDVSKVSASNRLRALYNLLNANSTKPDLMETFRTCYFLDRDRLFRLVSDHFR
jgi:hypothetical protein